MNHIPHSDMWNSQISSHSFKTVLCYLVFMVLFKFKFQYIKNLFSTFQSMLGAFICKYKTLYGNRLKPEMLKQLLPQTCI